MYAGCPEWVGRRIRNRSPRKGMGSERAINLMKELDVLKKKKKSQPMFVHFLILFTVAFRFLVTEVFGGFAGGESSSKYYNFLSGKYNTENRREYCRGTSQGGN